MHFDCGSWDKIDQDSFREDSVLNFKYLTPCLLDPVLAPQLGRTDSAAPLSSTVVEITAQYYQFWNLHLRPYPHPQFLERQGRGAFGRRL